MRAGGLAIKGALLAACSFFLWNSPHIQHDTTQIVPTKSLPGATHGGAEHAARTAQTTSLVPAFDAFRGPASAKGIIIWSHGRSLTREDSESQTPLYLSLFADQGWDVARFNRPRLIDKLADSTADLTARVHALRAQGYSRIVLAGQSYGGFIALGVAQNNPDVDTVIATAPAAYGNFFDSYESWEANRSMLDKLLKGVGEHTRVALAFFHGDDYDPGGRGEQARALLTAAHTPFMLIDQPRDLVGHLAANTGLFVRRYGSCLVTFAETAGAEGTACDVNWGLQPSVALLNGPSPDLLADATPEDHVDTGTSTAGGEEAPVTGKWYGYYPNGREFMVDVTGREGAQVDALYGIGPSVDGSTKATWIVRKGSVVDGALVFDEAGHSRITLTPTELGTMDVVWRAADGSGELEASARRLH